MIRDRSRPLSNLIHPDVLNSDSPNNEVSDHKGVHKSASPVIALLVRFACCHRRVADLAPGRSEKISRSLENVTTGRSRAPGNWWVSSVRNSGRLAFDITSAQYFLAGRPVLPINLSIASNKQDVTEMIHDRIHDRSDFFKFDSRFFQL